MLLLYRQLSKSVTLLRLQTWITSILQLQCNSSSPGISPGTVLLLMLFQHHHASRQSNQTLPCCLMAKTQCTCPGASLYRQSCRTTMTASPLKIASLYTSTVVQQELHRLT